MALDFAAMLAHEKRKKKEEAEKKPEQMKCSGGYGPGAGAMTAARQPLQELPVLDGPVADLYYLPDFLNEDEALALEHAILATPQCEWLTLPKRRLLNLGGVPHPDGVIAETLPAWLDVVLQKLQVLSIFPDGVVPNQVLLNRYSAGDGIDPHADGPLFEPYVAIISLQSSCLLQLLRPPGDSEKRLQGTTGRLAASWGDLDEAAATVYLQPRSLFIFSKDAYTKHLHGIATPDVAAAQECSHIDSRCVNLSSTSPKAATGDAVETGPRLSLTIRAVKKTAIPAGEFLTEAQQAEARRRRDWWARAVSEKI